MSDFCHAYTTIKIAKQQQNYMADGDLYIMKKD